MKKLSQYPPFETLDSLLNKLSISGKVNTNNDKNNIKIFLFVLNKNKIKKIAIGNALTKDSKNKTVNTVIK